VSTIIRGRYLAVTLLAAGCAGGCRSSEGFSSDASRGRGTAQALVPDENGRVADSTTGTTRIRGRWFASADTEDCKKRGKHAASECSVLIAPDPHAPAFRPTGDLGMCTAGIAAKAIPRPDGNPDWENIWGARIGLTLGDDGSYDAPAHGVTGFAFHIDSEPPPNSGIRVQLSTLASSKEPALWGGASAETSPVHAGENELRWADVAGPPYVESPPAFDPTHLLSLLFTVPASSAGAKSFGFCISRLYALTN
jgi:hypothetical protein